MKEKNICLIKCDLNWGRDDVQLRRAKPTQEVSSSEHIFDIIVGYLEPLSRCISSPKKAVMLKTGLADITFASKEMLTLFLNLFYRSI